MKTNWNWNIHQRERVATTGSRMQRLATFERGHTVNGATFINYEHAQRDGYTANPLNDSERARASELWSEALREKLRASADAEARADRMQVIADWDDDFGRP